MATRDNVLKNSMLISIVVFVGKLLGFIKQSFIAWAFGATVTTDIFFAAMSYVAMFGDVIAQSIPPTVLTRYIRLDEEGNQIKARQVVSQSLLFFGIIGIALMLMNMAFSSTLSTLIGHSYSALQKLEMQNFLVLLCPLILFNSLSGVAQGYLNACKHFLPAKLCSFFLSIMMIVCIVLGADTFGITALAYGVLLGYGLHAFYMLTLTIPKIGFFLGNPFKDHEFCIILKKFLPIVIGSSIIDIGLFLNRIIASSLEPGSLSALYYAQVISTDLVNAVIVTSVGTVLLTSFTKCVSNTICVSEICERIQLAICGTGVVLGLITTLYCVLSTDLVRVFFERGNFNSDMTHVVSVIVVCYSISFIGMAFREVFIKAHYAFQDTFIPMLNSICGLCINLIGSLILSRIIGVYGIAIATSCSVIIISLVSLYTLRKHLGVLPINKDTMIDIIKILFAALFTITAGKLCCNFIHDCSPWWRLISTGIIITAIYIVLIFLLKENIVCNNILPLIQVKLRKHK